MSNDKLFDEKLRELIPDLLNFPTVWSAASVEAEPEKWLESWQVFKVTDCVANHELYGFHFFGRNMREFAGAVSSKIVSFDPISMRGITNSGRVYQLVGPPGYCDDAQYVLDNWKHFNQVITEIGTQEFLKEYEIDN